MNFTDKTCQSTDWYTPTHIVEAVRDYFSDAIDLDPATTKDNPTKASLFIHPGCDPDGLGYEWCQRESVYLNPPYGRETRKWIEKVAREADRDTHIVTLLPTTRWETAYFQESILRHPRLSAVLFIRKRLSFLDRNGRPHLGNPHGSALWLFNGDYQRFAACFSDIGVVIRPTVVMIP